ncbi:MAG: S9 family peptidase [Candidatus Eremiobacteraeota bacterium]|nr:S9 family peptidase [Candidatus Eremiobacteraeota bacterium]
MSGIVRYIVWGLGAMACFFIFAGLAADPAEAGAPPLIPRSLLFGNPARAVPRISPDGTRLAYLAPHQGVLNVWVKTLGKTDDAVVTGDRKRGIHVFLWQGDSAHILYMQDNDGDENYHIFQTELATKATRDLTPFMGIRAEILAVDPAFPDTLLVQCNIRDRRYMDVYRINLKNGAMELDTKNPGDVADWVPDNTFTVRAAGASLPDGGMEIRTRKDGQSPWEVLMKWSGDDTGDGVVAFTPDNKGVYVLTSLGANAIRLLEIDLATKARKVIASDPQFDVARILTHPKNHTLLAVQILGERATWKAIDPGVAADLENLRKACDGDFQIISRDYANSRWTVDYTIDSKPPCAYEYDRSTGKAAFLFSYYPDLDKYAFSPMKPISFKARDGMQIYGYLTLPAGLPHKNLPLILNVHGGPWYRDRWCFNREVQWFANRGYAVLQINFRGSTGYGKAYLNAGNREWAGKMHDDLLDGKKWALAQGFADPRRVAIYGGSYGGYATLVGLAFTPDEFACGVDMVGPSNIITLMKTLPPYWEAGKAIFTRRVGSLEKDEEFLKSRSPLFKAGQIKAPLLIAQGANDPRVKQAESDQIVAAMRKNGKEVEYLLFPDEGHGFARPENNMIFYAAAEQFFAKHLGGRAEPVNEKEKADHLRK